MSSQEKKDFNIKLNRDVEEVENDSFFDLPKKRRESRENSQSSHKKSTFSKRSNHSKEGTEQSNQSSQSSDLENDHGNPSISIFQTKSDKSSNKSSPSSN